MILKGRGGGYMHVAGGDCIMYSLCAGSISGARAGKDWMLRADCLSFLFSSLGSGIFGEEILWLMGGVGLLDVYFCLRVVWMECGVDESLAMMGL